MGIKITEYSKYSLPMLFILMLYLSFLVVKSLLMALIAACVIAYILYPIYKRTKKHIRNRHLSALIVLGFSLLLITIPALFILNSLVEEATIGYVIAKQKITTFLAIDCSVSTNVYCSLHTIFDQTLGTGKMDYFIQEGVSKIGARISTLAYSSLTSLPSRFFDFLIFLFITYYLLIDGEKLLPIMRQILPFNVKQEEYIVHSLEDIIGGVVFGQILFALFLGIVGGLGFFIFGLSNPILWGLVMAFLAFIPLIGTTLVWIPGSILLISEGVQTDSNGLIIRGMLLFLYCLLFLTLPDLLLKPKIIGDRAKLHPILVLVGALGGISFLGPLGFILGPMILATLVMSIKIYELEKYKKNKRSDG